MRMRKKRHGNERLLALSALLYPNPGENAPRLAEVFGSERPLVLEVGCGKGEFITRLSLAEPDADYIALERVADVCVVAVEKYARSRGLGDMAPNGGWLAPDGSLYKDGAVWDIPFERRGNVRFLVADAADFAPKLEENSVSAILANFSDPWPGKGDHKKRLTSPAFLENYRRILKPDGVFRFKTDNDGLFDYTLETLPENGFRILWTTRDLHNSERAADNIVTEYERNFTERGVPIKMLEAAPVKDGASGEKA